MRSRAAIFAATAALAAGVSAAEPPSARRLGTVSIVQPIERLTFRNLGRGAIPNPRVLPAEEAPDSTSVRTIVAGVAAWRAYLADTSHRVEKRLELPSSPPPEPCRIRVFLDSANVQ